MGMTTFGAYKVSRTSPKVSVRIVNNRYDPATAVLQLTRIGEAVPFAEYTPVRITGSYFEFMFDDLLFDRAFGRYYAGLVMEGRVRQEFWLQYIDDVDVQISSDA